MMLSRYRLASMPYTVNPLPNLGIADSMTVYNERQ